MNQALINQQAAMCARMSLIAGAPVELTIRGDRAFTFSFEAMNVAGAECIGRFFAGQATVSIEHDAECGSFVYVEA